MLLMSITFYYNTFLYKNYQLYNQIVLAVYNYVLLTFLHNLLLILFFRVSIER